MASSSSLCAASSSSTYQALLRPQKLTDSNFINGVSSVSSPFISTNTKKTSVLPIRCRFSRPYRNSRYSSRMGGMTSNMNTASSTGAPKSVPVRVAHELLQAGHRYLDVRTPEEYAAGRAVGAVNVPYMFRSGLGMSKNPDFLEQVASQFSKDDEILVGCQSGKRSHMAANDLQAAGYTGIIDVSGGYAAWVQSAHPTEA